MKIHLGLWPQIEFERGHILGRTQGNGVTHGVSEELIDMWVYKHNSDLGEIEIETSHGQLFLDGVDITGFFTCDIQSCGSFSRDVMNVHLLDFLLSNPDYIPHSQEKVHFNGTTFLEKWKETRSRDYHSHFREQLKWPTLEYRQGAWWKGEELGTSSSYTKHVSACFKL